MDIKTAVKERHSVRSYTDTKITDGAITELQQEIALCNSESALNIQLVTDEPNAFGGFMAHYGKFENVKNYVALIGAKSDVLQEKIGYYGERIALKAQMLGLNTCWVAMTFSKRKSRCSVNKNEKLVCVLSLGYGKTQGVAHKSKPAEKLSNYNGEMPEWFKNGIKSAMLAPTATNQQKFLISGNENKVNIKSLGGFYSKVDLGIVKYHFEIGAGKKNFQWENEKSV